MGHTSQVCLCMFVLFCSNTNAFDHLSTFVFQASVQKGILNKAWLTALTKYLYCLFTKNKCAITEHRAETKTSYSKPGSTNQGIPLRVNEMYVYVIIFTVPGLMSSKTTSATVNCFCAWSSVSVFIKPHNTNSSRWVTTVRGEGIRQQCANERERERVRDILLCFLLSHRL